MLRNCRRAPPHAAVAAAARLSYSCVTGIRSPARATHGTGSDQAPRVPYAARRHSRMAARGARAADAGDGVSQRPSSAQFTHLLAAFRKGLGEAGYAEGRNVAIEYRYADGRYDRLPALAADLVNQRVHSHHPRGKGGDLGHSDRLRGGGDPVTFGIVDSLNRPGGNITGVTLIAAQTVAKRLELLLELVSGTPHSLAD